MRRGDVYWAALDPAWPAECDKTRPVVIVSNDAANRRCEQLGRGVVTVVPLTSRTNRLYRFQVLLPAGTAGLPTASKAQAEQVRTIAVGRLTGRLGTLGAEHLSALDRALRVHLAL
jgi:mRNA interferase MazF